MGFIDPDNAAYFDYWANLSRGKMVPDKASFLPEEIPKLLQNITIYELKSKDEILFRLCGTQIVSRDGGDRKGENYLDYVAEGRREQASEALWCMLRKPCAMRVLLNYASNLGNVKKIECIGTPIVDYKRDKSFLYYSSREIVDQTHYDKKIDEQVERVTVLERNFIDIGAGIPDFKD